MARTEKARETKQVEKDLELEKMEQEKTLIEIRHSNWLSDQEHRKKEREKERNSFAGTSYI